MRISIKEQRQQYFNQLNSSFKSALPLCHSARGACEGMYPACLAKRGSACHLKLWIFLRNTLDNFINCQYLKKNSNKHAKWMRNERPRIEVTAWQLNEEKKKKLANQGVEKETACTYRTSITIKSSISVHEPKKKKKIKKITNYYAWDTL